MEREQFYEEMKKALMELKPSLSLRSISRTGWDCTDVRFRCRMLRQHPHSIWKIFMKRI